MNKEKLERLRKELLSMVDKPKPMCDAVTWNYSIAFTLRILKLVEIDKTLSEVTQEEIDNFTKNDGFALQKTGEQDE